MELDIWKLAFDVETISRTQTFKWFL